MGVSINAGQKKVIIMKSNNKSYERCMFNQIKQIFATYFSQILPQVSIL